MEDIKLTFKFGVFCTCGDQLKAVVKTYEEGPYISVEPCEHCIIMARDDGRNEPPEVNEDK